MKATISIKPNMKFGSLTVIEKDKQPRKDKHTYWKCVCECGKELIVRSTHLRSGQTTSCGCTKGLIDNQIIDITNQRFGMLVALKSTNERSGNHVKWLCQCDCGKQLLIDHRSLRLGLTKSCGCATMSHGEMKIKELLEQKGISFIQEYSFPNCKYSNGYSPRFDFYVQNEYVIEYDGVQHFDKNNPFYHGTESDDFKIIGVLKNNIPLIRIPYWHYEDLSIEDLLLETTVYCINDVMS